MTSAEAMKAIHTFLDLYFRGELDVTQTLHAIAQVTGAAE